MKISIFVFSEQGEAKRVIYGPEEFYPDKIGNDDLILEEAESFALRNVVVGYFGASFGMSSHDVVSGDGSVLTRILRCSGRNVRYRSDENGRLVKEKDESDPDRVFEIVVTK